MVYGGSTLDGLRIPLDDGRSGRQRRRRNRMLFCVGVLVMGGVGVVFVRSLRSLEGAYTSASPGVSQAAQESSAIASRHFPDQVLKAAFTTFDANGDGTISTEEIKNIMRELGENIQEADIQNVLGTIDANGDGFIDYDEFTQVVTKEMREGGFSLV